MNDLHDRVRAALHDAVAGVPFHPDEREVARRTKARRLRRTTTRVAVIGAAAAAAVTGMALTNGWGLAERGAATLPSQAPSPAPATIASATTVGTAPCRMPTDLPFEPAYLPAGWTQGPFQRDVGVATWAGPVEGTRVSAVIEVWNGGRGDLPALEAPVETISILGRTGTIADISDGYAVMFELGPSACDRWALLAHPSTTRAQLLAVAEALALPSTTRTTTTQAPRRRVPRRAIASLSGSARRSWSCRRPANSAR